MGVVFGIIAGVVALFVVVFCVIKYMKTTKGKNRNRKLNLLIKHFIITVNLKFFFFGQLELYSDLVDRESYFFEHLTVNFILFHVVV